MFGGDADYCPELGEAADLVVDAAVELVGDRVAGGVLVLDESVRERNIRSGRSRSSSLMPASRTNSERSIEYMSGCGMPTS